MDLQKIENEVLHLPKSDRALLIQKLVLSFDTPTPQELREDWLLEAQSRAKQIDDGLVKLVSAEDVLKKARAITE